MTNVRANCRERFTAADLDFVAASLSERSRGSTTLPNDPDAQRFHPATAGQALNASHSALHALLSDPEALDAALDDERLVRSLLEFPGHIPVTPQFYFYVLTRHMLMRFDRSIADYVASVLAACVTAGNGGAGVPACELNETYNRKPTNNRKPGGSRHQTNHLPYITDMLIALRSASSEREFMIRVQVGNYSLFLSGIFPQHIAHRSTHHASPPISFYEEVGSQNYRRASDHRLAREQSLVDTYRTIAERFSEVRVGLNQMSDRLLCLEGMQ